MIVTNTLIWEIWKSSIMKQSMIIDKLKDSGNIIPAQTSSTQEIQNLWSKKAQVRDQITWKSFTQKKHDYHLLKNIFVFDIQENTTCIFIRL